MMIKSALKTKKIRFFINRNFALLWIGQTISVAGDVIFDTTLVLWIAAQLTRGQSWAPLAVSGVLLSSSLPALLIGPIAGVFVDRWDKRRTMLRMDIIRAIVISALLLIIGVTKLPFIASSQRSVFWLLGAIYVVSAAESVFAQFFGPSRVALIGDVVPGAQRARAMSLNQTTLNLALFIGPSLAALLFFAVGVQWAILLNALSFVASFLIVSQVSIPPLASKVSAQKIRNNFFSEFREGIDYFIRDRVLVMIVVTGILFMCGGGTLNALYVLFVIHNLHASPELYGLFGSAAGIGAIAGAALAGAVAVRIGVSRMLWGALLVCGIIIILFARQTNAIPAFLLFFLFGLSNAAINVVVGPLMLQVTPREMVGRFVAVLGPSVNCATLLSTALAGYLAGTLLSNFHATLFGVPFGSLDTIFTASGLLIIIAGIYAMVIASSTNLTQDVATQVSNEESL